MSEPSSELPASGPDRPVRVHLTNVSGLGAVQLVRSLLPALESCPGYRIEEIYLPDRGHLCDYRPLNRETRATRTRRVLPNSMSRLIECTFGGARFSGTSPLLVLGDLPLRCAARQTLFVQTPLLTQPDAESERREGIRHRIARAIFQFNLAQVSTAIVQTGVMKSALEDTYPALSGRVQVVAQPVPEWLRAYRPGRSARGARGARGLRLIYPAAGYPHKNHRLLASVDPQHSRDWPVESLTLTLVPSSHPNPSVGWIRCVGRLDADSMIREYQAADALLFLSLSESYGFPLVEAMWMNLPIVCPDLAYARWLCGDSAIYFDPASVASLRSALVELDSRLHAGWRPNWQERLERLPRDWQAVARTFLDIVYGIPQRKLSMNLND